MLRLHSDQCIGYLGHRVIGDLHAYRTDLKDSTMAKKMNQAMTDFFSLLRCIGTVKIWLLVVNAFAVSLSVYEMRYKMPSSSGFLSHNNDALTWGRVYHRGILYADEIVVLNWRGRWTVTVVKMTTPIEHLPWVKQKVFAEFDNFVTTSIYILFDLNTTRICDRDTLSTELLSYVTL